MDYIAISPGVFPARDGDASAVFQHFDLGHANTDRYPVSLRAAFRQERTADVPLRRAPIVDAAAISEPAALATFRAALAAV
eukprot:15464193-Alexandrium_andersonii.AAC.1